MPLCFMECSYTRCTVCEIVAREMCLGASVNWDLMRPHCCRRAPFRAAISSPVVFQHLLKSSEWRFCGNRGVA